MRERLRHRNGAYKTVFSFLREGALEERIERAERRFDGRDPRSRTGQRGPSDVGEVVAGEGSVAGQGLEGEDGESPEVDLLVDDAELQSRRAAYKPVPPQFDHGVLGKYAKRGGSADAGAGCR